MKLLLAIFTNNNKGGSQPLPPVTKKGDYSHANDNSRNQKRY